jgi:hypothetical protein
MRREGRVCLPARMTRPRLVCVPCTKEGMPHNLNCVVEFSLCPTHTGMPMRNREALRAAGKGGDGYWCSKIQQGVSTIIAVQGFRLQGLGFARWSVWGAGRARWSQTAMCSLM